MTIFCILYFLGPTIGTGCPLAHSQLLHQKHGLKQIYSGSLSTTAAVKTLTSLIGTQAIVLTGGRHYAKLSPLNGSKRQ